MGDLKSFPVGGTHLPECKWLSNERPIRAMAVPQAQPPPQRVVIPLRQHIGAPARAVVAVGEQVTAGQVIGEAASGVSAMIHASIAGRVVELGERRMVEGSMCACVVIEAEAGAATQAPDPATFFAVEGPEAPVPAAAEIIEAVRQAGVVGMGGAVFPSHIKLQAKHETPIDTVLLNGAECEPYLTTDDRLMQEQAAAIFRGLEIIRCTVGAEVGIVACEVNKPLALQRLAAEAERWPHLHSVRLSTRYPHGAEKHLIKAVLDREVPLRQLPMAVGVVVNNVHSAVAIAQAVDRHQPMIARVLTVSGSAVSDPSNLLVPIGTPIRELIAAVGGPQCAGARIIVGGPMTGTATEDLDLPVTKATSGVVLLRPEDCADRRFSACIGCSRCVEVCPMYLQPNRITAFVRQGMYEPAEEFGLHSCILCGACSFVCPAQRPLVQWLREGKMRSPPDATPTTPTPVSHKPDAEEL